MKSYLVSGKGLLCHCHVIADSEMGAEEEGRMEGGRRGD